MKCAGDRATCTSHNDDLARTHVCVCVCGLCVRVWLLCVYVLGTSIHADAPTDAYSTVQVTHVPLIHQPFKMPRRGAESPDRLLTTQSPSTRTTSGINLTRPGTHEEARSYTPASPWFTVPPTPNNPAETGIIFINQVRLRCDVSRGETLGVQL